MVYRVLLFLICSLIPISGFSKTLLVLGDSLSAAYGIPVTAGWVSLLERRIIEQKLDYRVVNASISGETTLGARSRLDELLARHQPQLVLLELGGNDGLRGVALTEIAQNLVAMITTIKQHGSPVLLVPMQLPPNYGATYNERFKAIYKSIAHDMNVRLSMFILQGIADKPSLMQEDGIHPVQAAQAKMLDNIWLSLQPLLE